jgi:hypothetical protein
MVTPSSKKWPDPARVGRNRHGSLQLLENGLLPPHGHCGLQLGHVAQWPANTISISLNRGYAETGNGKLFYPGSQASSTEIFTMTDDKGDEDIEIVSGQGSTGYQGQHSPWFSTNGCAVDGGCTR